MGGKDALVQRTHSPQEPYALFCSEDRNGCHLEVYPRPGGDVYLCGLGGSDHVRGDRLKAKGDCSAPELILVWPVFPLGDPQSKAPALTYEHHSNGRIGLSCRAGRP
jgi:hypothetical protein